MHCKHVKQEENDWYISNSLLTTNETNILQNNFENSFITMIHIYKKSYHEKQTSINKGESIPVQKQALVHKPTDLQASSSFQDSHRM